MVAVVAGAAMQERNANAVSSFSEKQNVVGQDRSELSREIQERPGKKGDLCVAGPESGRVWCQSYEKCEKSEGKVRTDDAKMGTD